MKILITGIQGFLGTHLGIYMVKKGNEIVGIQRNNFKDMYSGVFYHDLRYPISDLLRKRIGKIDVIIHLAAMSHVDRSIKDPIGAVLDNILGTFNLLEYARKAKPKLFLYFSTDEVFGSNTNDEKFKEWDRFKPGSPYAATKAAGEDLCLAYYNTYGVPIIITHCMNIFGEGQHKEKFIPKAVDLIKKGKVVPIYADKKGKKSGARSYIDVRDVCRAIEFIVSKGIPGEKYNIPGAKEITNIEMAHLIAKTLKKPLKTKFIATDNVRPGNDFRYGIDGNKLESMGFILSDNTISRIIEVIKWHTQ